MEYTITYKFLIMSRRLVLLKHPNCLFLRWRIAPLRKELWAMGTTSGVDPGWSLRLENGWCIFSGWSRSFCKNRIESFQNQRETVFSLLFFSQVSIECVWLFHIQRCSACECHYLKLVQKANILAWGEATNDVWVFCIGNDGSRAIIKLWPLTLINGLIVIYLTLVIGVICPFVTVNGHSCKLSWMICNVTTQVTTSQIPSEGSKWVRSPSRHNSTNSLDWGSVTYKSGGPGAISCRCLTYKILKFPPHSTTSRCQ